MNILITGGLGYIGSHLAVELLKIKSKIFIIDNLSNSSIKKKKMIERISKKKVKFFKNDLTDHKKISLILKKHNIEFVIHLAGLKAVNESVLNPHKYFFNNSFGTLQLLKAMENSKTKKIIYSSSATVYGAVNKNPIQESDKLRPINPYGTSKLISEKMIIDYSKNIKNFQYFILRYFNPLGYHKSGLLSQDNSKDNLIPNLLKSIKNKKTFLVYGKNYKTKDGTAIRDYIHINDLISAHIVSLKSFKKTKNQIFNVGTGYGHTVMEIVNIFNKNLNRKINFRYTKRRLGDPESIFCSINKIHKFLKWKPKCSLLEMCKDSI